MLTASVRQGWDHRVCMGGVAPLASIRLWPESERLYGRARRARFGRQEDAGADYAITPASRGVSERVASLRWYDWSSSNSGVSLATRRAPPFRANVVRRLVVGMPVGARKQASRRYRAAEGRPTSGW
jgi:hypothetical protein